MPTNSTEQIDAVKLVRELLGSGAVQLPLRVEGWHKSLTAGGHFIRHTTGRTLATVEFVPVEIETGRPAVDGNAPARAIVALLNAIPTLADEVEQLRELVVHMHVHSGYRDNGYLQMTTPQKALYDAVWERSVKELDEEENEQA